MGLHVQETHVALEFEPGGEERRALVGESPVYDTGTENIGKVFRTLQKRWGRCVSKLYRDTESGRVPVGWVFEARVPYADRPKETYIREMWVELHHKPPTVRKTRYLQPVDGSPVLTLGDKTRTPLSPE